MTVTRLRLEASTIRKTLAALVCVAGAFLFPRGAAAEKILANMDGWEVYTDGRAGGFVTWVHGDGYPPPDYGYAYDANGPILDPNGRPVFVNTPVDTPQNGGGFKSISQQGLSMDPSLTNNQRIPNQGTIDVWRLRSGFIPNVFGFGVRGHLTPNTKLMVYVQFWAFIENLNRQKNQLNVVDARQGYGKIEGRWGSLTAGRTRTLFSRGATDIDVLYAHRWGVGWTGAIDGVGPTTGQIGFGVLGSGFSSALIYGTPNVVGLQLNVGIFDPVQLQGGGSWARTKYPRPEAELTFDRSFRGGWGKIVLFVNGAYQKVYKDGDCAPVFDPTTNRNLPCDATIAGVGYGGRLELGPFHLGVAGHYGKGLGMYYAVEASDAAQDKNGNLRTISGSYVQTQVVLRKVDLFAGWGISQIYLTEYDDKYKQLDPRDARSTDPDPAVQATANQIFPFSQPKYQMGFNGGIVYNASPALHFDLDFFRAQAGWYGVNGFPDPKQVVWVSSGGMTVAW